MAGLARRRPGFLNRLIRPDTSAAAIAVRRAEEQATEVRYQDQAALAPAPFYRSIRFRLTAWYALILLVVLVSFGLVLRTLVIREIQSNVDSRLLVASQEIVDQTGVTPAQLGARKDQQGNVNIRDIFLINPPPVNSILLSGLWLGVFDKKGDPVPVGSAALNVLPDDLKLAFENGRVLQVDQRVYKTIEVSGKKSRVLVYPLEYEGSNGVPEVAGAVLVGEPLGNGDRIVSLIDNVLQIASVAGIALAGFGGWILAGRALAPVERISRSADGIANSEGMLSLSQRLDVPHTGDELSRLSLTFNAMLDRIEAAFIAQRRFVSDASHELRTPLTSVRGNVEVLLRQHKSGRVADPADVADALGDVQRESARMGRLIDDLLTLARTDTSGIGYILKPGIVSLDVLAREAFQTASSLPHTQEMTLEANQAVTINGDGDRLVQVMIILLDNALRYTPPDGRIVLRVTQGIDAREGVECARIDVEDTGPGIATEHLPHVFERFYRAENSRTRSAGGTGLGLSIALAIVRGHGGWIDIETAAGVGTTFTVWLPLAVPTGEPTTDPGDVATERDAT
jgi:signal transduction histidine kinase